LANQLEKREIVFRKNNGRADLLGKISTVFMGSDAIALPMLQDLFTHFKDRVQLKGVITQPDRHSGRGMKLHANPIKSWAIENNIAVQQPVKLGSEICDWLDEQDCDLIIIMAYGRILRDKLLKIPELGVINLHASLLPAYRGASPIPAAIASGDRFTGVTIMRVVPELDAGPILDYEKVGIDLKDDSQSLGKKIGKAAAIVTQRNLLAIIEGKSKFVPQNNEEASFTRLLNKEDGVLDFQVSANDLVNRVRALKSWPGCFFYFDKQRIKIGEVEADNKSSSIEPGVILGEERGALCVSTGAGILRILELQRPGGRMLPAKDFLRGLKMECGTALPEKRMFPLVSSQPFLRGKGNS